MKEIKIYIKGEILGLWTGTLNIIKISIFTKLVMIKYNPNQKDWDLLQIQTI